MRWWILAPLLVACTGDPVDTAETDTDTTDTADSGDTDTEVPIQWTDRTIETSTTLTGVYSGGQGAFVVGEGGDAWRIAGGNPETIATGTEADLSAVWGRSDGDSMELMAVGYAGGIFSWDGAALVRVEDDSLGTTNFEDIDGLGDDMTAVSVTGIYRLQDGDWAFESTGFNRSLRAVYVQASGDAWAVGDSGTILRRQAGTWSQLPAPSGVDLLDVDGAGEDVYIVGNRGTVLHWDGTEFVDLESDTSINLAGVWVADSGKAYVVGSNGLAMMWDPDMEPAEDDTDPALGGFVTLPTDSSSNLYAVYGSSESNIWAVGNRGAVYRFTGMRTE